MPEFLTCSVMAGSTGIQHGFFTRIGGVSTGLYSSLNCGFGSGDAPENVAENRSRALTAMGLEKISMLTCNQIHSAEAIFVERSWQPGAAPRADAMVTNLPHVALGILTADCAPVLFADQKNHVIAAVHAGWRGAISGITDNTIKLMVSKGAERANIVAAIGPAISKTSYEVGAEFRHQFMDKDPENVVFFLSGKNVGKFHFDLPAYLVSRLQMAGISQISVMNRDTCLERTYFYSYRRSLYNADPEYGRGLSLIALTPAV